MTFRHWATGVGLALAAPAFAIPPLNTPPPPAPPPKLTILLVVDQLSADLWNEYRPQWTGGFARLAEGSVFRNGFQSHAATETCPGHAAIATGARPSRNGIIGNEWVDFSAPRTNKTIYCAEDERVPGSTSKAFTLSPVHLRVPTIGDLLKSQRPASRVVSIAGKDRSAIMLGGRDADLVIHFDDKAFVVNRGAAPPSLPALNAAIARQIAESEDELVPTPFCAAKAKSVQVENHIAVGAGAFARRAGDERGWRTSPAADGATLALAAATVRDLRLGQGQASDLLAVGLSANDYVGHYYGPNGQEMCLQLTSLDRDLGDFFARLDSWGIDYAVALSSDHGGADLPERARLAREADAQRIDGELTPARISEKVRAKTGIQGPILYDFGSIGDHYLAPDLKGAERDRASRAAMAEYRAHPQVEAIFSRGEIVGTSLPTGDPGRWTLIERVRAGFDPQRSGDFFLVLKDHVSPIGHVEWSVATHGSPWDHDRKVPIVFWRGGLTAADRAEPAETVDIAPTLAAMLGLQVARGAFDGRCLSGMAGIACPPR